MITDEMVDAAIAANMQLRSSNQYAESYEIYRTIIGGAFNLIYNQAIEDVISMYISECCAMPESLSETEVATIEGFKELKK